MLTPTLLVVVPLVLLAVYVAACRLTARSFVVDRDAHRRAQAEWRTYRQQAREVIR